MSLSGANKGASSWVLAKSILRDRRLLGKMGVIVLLSSAFLAFRAWASPSIGMMVVRYGGYWLTLALVLLLSYQALSSFPFALGRRVMSELKIHRTGWLIALVASVLWQVNEPRQFKVLFDEHGYAGIAQSMHLDREAAYPSRAHYFDGEQHVLNYGVDKRAVLFPFVVSVAHDLTGFRKENGFYVNAVLGALSLILVYYLLLRVANRRIAYCGQALWFGLPLLAQIATGGGYDLLNICLLIGWLLSALRYLETNGNGGDEVFFVGITVALAQVRNESVLYLVGAALLIWWKWTRRGRAELSWHSLLFLPFLIMPVAANVLFSKVEGMLETAPGQDFFSLLYVPENLANAVAFVFDPDLEGMNSSLLGYMGVFCVLLFVVDYIKEGIFGGDIHASTDKALFVFMGMVAGAFMVYMSSFWGAWTDPIVSRFSLPIWLLFLVVVARVAAKGFKGRDVPLWAPVAFAIWGFGVGIPASAQAEATRIAVTSTERIFLEEQLGQTAPGDVLLIVASPLMSVIDGYSATGVAGVNAEPWKVQAVIDLKLYKEIWVGERYYYSYISESWQREEKYALAAGFKQEPVSSMKLGNGAEFRISRILAWRDPESAKEKITEAFTPRPITRLDYFKRLVPLLP
ncbi:MAG: glycosyltransferase family 39 protein [Burkholderiales bacterium]|nr:glycosyltransferase family 39 protein [Opitutaceae bacterium]